MKPFRKWLKTHTGQWWLAGISAPENGAEVSRRFTVREIRLIAEESNLSIPQAFDEIHAALAEVAP